jgi:hypothetical protein
MSPVVQCVSVDSGNFTPQTLTFDNPSMPGNALVAFVGVFACTSATTVPNFDVADDASGGSNIWHPVPNGQIYAGGAFTLEMYYCWTDSSGSAPPKSCQNITATPNANGVAAGVTQSVMNIAELSGVRTSSDPLDVDTGANAVFQASFSTGTIVPTADGLALCAYADTSNNVSTPPSPGPGYTAVAPGGFDPTNPFILIEYMATKSGVGFVGSGSGNGGGFNVITVASFKTSPVAHDALFYGMT